MRPTATIGAFAPLTSPGFAPAGGHLAAGLRLGAEDAGLEVLLRDTEGSPERAAAALHELEAEGVVAVAGEYHSVVARRLADLAHALELPFVCSSATLDRLTSTPTDRVARLAPPQSHGWHLYADHLAANWHEHVAVAIAPDEYWSSGAAVVEARLGAHGVRCSRVDVMGLPAGAVANRVTDLGAETLLLLVAHPEPMTAIARAVGSGVRLGDPAGRVEFGGWPGVPYLSYAPSVLSRFGAEVAERLEHELGEPPSFVALEGYDAILVLAAALHLAGPDREAIARALPAVEVEGTRGTIRLSRVPGIPVLQWAWPPVRVTEAAARALG
jgi:ABC-type branched-subunit amino acid transport system substrate-binding protein